jgi:hypothetical protein
MISCNDVRPLIAELTHPAHFFVGRIIGLEWEHAPSEEVFWEIFQGQLLDGTQTRQRQIFESWNLFQLDRTGRSGVPLLSVKVDPASAVIHIVRGIHCYAWEGYHAGDNVYLSRETTRWVRELVRTIALARFSHVDDLRTAIRKALFQAIVGVSRLPLTSLQAPLPAFTLGELAYYYQPRRSADAPLRSNSDLLDRALTIDLSWLEQTKLLETVLRATPFGDLENTADLFSARWIALEQSRAQLLALFRSLFDEVSLSPFTDFVDKTLLFLDVLLGRDHISAAELVDFLSYLLRQLGRHLTAYDLVTFHHFGANYPDALLLDAVLKRYLALIEAFPNLFTSSPDAPEEKQVRRRRRALRQGWLLRRRYEGHPVPDAPTSPGENARVLPPPHQRVPQEQILNPLKRTRRLYEDDPLPKYLGDQGRDILRQSIDDLSHPQEQLELGMALLVDRPLGAFQSPGEPDQSLLLSYEAFSWTIAQRRLEELERCLDNLIEPGAFDECRRNLRERSGLTGVALEPRTYAVGPEPVSLDDALKVADDFLLLRSTRRSVQEFLALFDVTSLADRSSSDFLQPDGRVLIVRSAAKAGTLFIYDDKLRKRLEVQIELGDGGKLTADLSFKG